MCLHPIRIGNPTRRFVRGLSRPLLTVPCGHCKECISKQQDDWFVRSVFESKRVQSKDGAVWFPTLTYNDSYLPIWTDPKHNYSCPCFDTKHIISFRNKLRVYLTRKGYDCSGENTIRYMICCEYGSKKGRSHLHCLLYVPFDVPNKVMHEVLQKAWIYGFVMWSNRGMIAQGLKASQYCMKYISKEMSWYKQYGVDKYLQILHDDIDNARSKEEQLAAIDLLKAFRRVTPGHRQSMGVGVDGLDYFRNDDGSWNKQLLLDGVLESSKLGLHPTKRGDSFVYNMPMYYVRKVFYTPDEWKLYKLNDLGQEIFCERFELTQKRKAEKLSVYTYSPVSMSVHLGSSADYDTVCRDHLYIKTMMRDRFLSDLVLFDTVYRDIEINSVNRAFVDAVQGMTDRQALDFFSDNALDFMLAQKTIDVTPAPKNCKDRSNYRVADVTFNGLPCFSGFSKILDMIEDYEHKLGLDCQKAYEVERLRQENLFGTGSNYSTNLIFREL